MEALDIIRYPVVSERSTALMERNVYVFVVEKSATKVDIRRAVEEAFKVRVLNVNTMIRKGKTIKNRRTNTTGRRSDTKRALVTVHAQDKINIFEN